MVTRRPRKNLMKWKRSYARRLLQEIRTLSNCFKLLRMRRS